LAATLIFFCAIVHTFLSGKFLVANGLYFAVFRKELAAMQHDFALQALKDRIQTELLKRRGLEAEIDRFGSEGN
jgi:hypothetical protein